MAARLRIALTHEHCWPHTRRGGERLLHELACALARRGHDVTIIAGAPSKSRAVESGVLVERLVRGDQRRTLHDVRFFGELQARLVLRSFDVVHSLGPWDALASLRAQRIRRHRLTVYTNLGLPIRDWWDRQPEGRAHARVARAIDIYGCLSNYGLSCLRQDYGRDGVLTSGGVRMDAFRPVGDRDSRPTILYSGVLDDPRKGVSTLLEAVSILSHDEPELRLWLSGPGDPRPMLAAAPYEARTRTEVLPLGELEDQPRRYSAAWATVLPSIGEALGIVLLESLACGTPIVASDDAGSLELVRPGAGALARPEDPVGLAEACAAAFDLARQASTRDRCREAARPYDWDTSVAPAMEEIYEGSVNR